MRPWHMLSLFLLLAMPGAGLVLAEEAVLTFHPPAGAVPITPGEPAVLRFGVRVIPPWHINANKPGDEYLIPTELTLTGTPNLSPGAVTYPHAESVKLEFSEEPLLVYEGNVTLTATLTAIAGTPQGAATMSGTFRYQACNNSMCLAPKSIDFEVPLEILAGAAVKAIEPPAGAIERAAPMGGLKDESKGIQALLSPSLDFQMVLTKYGSWGYVFIFFAVFLGGILMNLTPCVLPVIPITIGYFTNQAKQKHGSTMLLSMAYVLGIAITFSALGTFASLTGGLWGAALQSPYVLIFVALVLTVLAFSMFGYYDISVPGFISQHIGAKQGYLGAVFMGLVVGIVAAPCVGPIILGLMLFVSAMGSPILGMALFFTLAWGFGLPYLILGAFTGAASRIPMGGAWMDIIKYIFGMVLLGMALYFVQPILPARVYEIILPAFVCTCGAVLLFAKSDKYQTPVAAAVFRGIGLTTLAAGIWIMIPAKHAEGIEWQPFTTEAFAAAKKSGKPILIDAGAAWCIPCRELEHTTFRDPRVVVEAERFVRFKMDLTAEDAVTESLRREFMIRGVPTVMFFDATGKENEALRLNKYVKGGEFHRLLKEVP